MKRRDFSGASARLAEAARRRPAAETARSAHIRTVQAQIDAIGRGDLSAALESAREDVLLEIFAPPEFPWIRTARGLADLHAAMTHNFGSVDDQRPEIQNVVAEGESVVLFGREHGVIRETGHPYDVQFVQRFTFVEGRLASIRIVAAKTEVA